MIKKKSDKSPNNKKSKWKQYTYSLIAAEISTTTRFCDKCFQVSPLPHDSGQLLELIDCKEKLAAENEEAVEVHKEQRDKRIALVFNGNFSYMTDIEGELKQLKKRLSRHSRLFVVVYNPFMKPLYKIAEFLGLRKGPLPETFLTNNDIHNIARLSGYEVARIRPSVFLPLQIPLLSPLINCIFPIIPIIRRMSFVWVVMLRPVMVEKNKPSLTVVIPARNEEGNIRNAITRIPNFPGTDVEVIFIEGGSTDKTWERIQELTKQKHESLSVRAFQQQGRGKYDAVRLGFDHAKHDLVTILDADLTMPPELLSRFYEAYCRGLGDFINGNRLLYNMEKEAMRPLNRLGNILFSKVLALILGIKIGDSLCGTKMFSSRDYRRIVEWRAWFGDFDPFGDFEMLFAASELGLGIQDIPIYYRARSYGETQISRFQDGIKLCRMVLIGFFRIFLGKIK
jgi:hypothetical protein